MGTSDPSPDQGLGQAPTREREAAQQIASAGLREILKNPARMRAAQGRVLMKVRMLKAAIESSSDPEQRATLIAALRKGVRAEIRRSVWAREDDNYRQTLIMIDHECDLDAAVGG
jgi:hypothetical protein